MAAKESLLGGSANQKVADSTNGLASQSVFADQLLSDNRPGNDWFAIDSLIEIPRCKVTQVTAGMTFYQFHLVGDRSSRVRRTIAFSIILVKTIQHLASLAL